MELSSDVLGGLQLAGDAIRIPDKCFLKLVLSAIEDLLRNDINENIFEEEEYSSVDRGVLKQALYGLITVFVEAAKNGIETVMLQSVLDDCKVSTERGVVICDTYKKNASRLINHLQSYTFHLPRVVDVDWRLDYCVMSHVVDKINQPLYTIELKTQSNSSQCLDTVKFTCSVEELQDLVGKLKDAVKCWTKKTENLSV
ncbi:COMM domain containing 3 [Chamberlinius hualienensis]